MHLAVPFAPQHGARPQVRRTAGQIHGALPCVLGRHRTVEQTLALAVQITQHVGLQPIRQDAKQKMTGQVRMGSPPEYVMPTASKLPDVEIAQARNLAVECLAVRQGRSNPDARHGAQDDWRSDLRGPCFLLSVPAIW